MKKYAIAYLSFFENDNTIEIVEAINELEALKELTKNDDLPEGIHLDSIQAYKNYFSDGEIAVSTPMEIK